MYGPRSSFDEKNRDIDLGALRLARAWHFRAGLELQFGGLFLMARGTKTEPFSPDPPARSDTAGFGLGPTFRWNPVEVGRLRIFGDASGDFIYSKPAFPAGGSSVNGFPRAGAGASWRVSDRVRIEAGYRWAHVSNGAGIVPGNPAWNGSGLYFGLRKSL